MPRTFLVKKVNFAAEKRSWSEIPDSARGDVYIPAFSPDKNGAKRFLNGNGVLSCQVCQKTFTTYSCEHCGKGFNDAFDLKRHVRTHTGVRLYKCTMCVKAFAQRCSLESHLKKIHAVTQQYECGLTAQTRDGLQNHLQAEHPQRLIMTKSNHKLTHILEGNTSPCST
uniref:Ovo-like zinc finger 1b n=1 Tax=Sinocyclocheilus grahami TaxID=75366 RepID=A0A672Q1K1_SINGR